MNRPFLAFPIAIDGSTQARDPRSRRHLKCRTWPIFGALALLSLPLVAGDFGVSPIRLDLSRGAKTGAVTVTNNGESPLRAQVKVFAWSQDAEGQDRYEESADLTYLPRLMTVPPKGKQLVRAGVRLPAAEREKAYRLFIEELPEPYKAQMPGAQVAIAVRFGVPVFVKPLKEKVRGEIEKVSLTKGTLRVKIKNSGNTHFAIESINLQSGNGFATEVPGWYLLPGAARTYSATIPATDCSALGSLEITVKTDKISLNRVLKVNRAMCP